jgi:hypothetical protein
MGPSLVAMQNGVRSLCLGGQTIYGPNTQLDGMRSVLPGL